MIVTKTMKNHPRAIEDSSYQMFAFDDNGNNDLLFIGNDDNDASYIRMTGKPCL